MNIFRLEGLLTYVYILILREPNLKLQVEGLFSRFVRALSSKVSSSEEPANTMSIYRVK